MATGAVVDLRTDTVSQPTAAMRRAMAGAVVGDDVYREDPTVRALEERAALLLGVEAALFVPSGTMANLIAVMVHVPRGGEVIADERSHIVLNEAGGASTLLSAPVRTVRSDRWARLSPQVLTDALRDRHNHHHPRTALLMLENTHAHRMGMPLDPQDVRRMASWAHDRGLAVHVDGARLANAALALGLSMAELLAPVDSSSLCLSKGLACPAGSLVLGRSAFIEEARRARKMLGGGQRQVGILAAAGLIALSDGPDSTLGRLAEDHARAARLAQALAELPQVDLDASLVRTNIVIFKVTGGLRGRAAFLAALAAEGVRMMAYPRGHIRAVTHIDISDTGLERALTVVRRVLKG